MTAVLWLLDSNLVFYLQKCYLTVPEMYVGHPEREGPINMHMGCQNISFICFVCFELYSTSVNESKNSLSKEHIGIFVQTCKVELIYKCEGSFTFLYIVAGVH